MKNFNKKVKATKIKKSNLKTLTKLESKKVKGGDYSENAVNPFEWVHAKFNF